jgi:hypothetical protein
MQFFYGKQIFSEEMAMSPAQSLFFLPMLSVLDLHWLDVVGYFEVEDF